LRAICGNKLLKIFFLHKQVGRIYFCFSPTALPLRAQNSFKSFFFTNYGTLEISCFVQEGPRVVVLLPNYWCPFLFLSTSRRFSVSADGLGVPYLQRHISDSAVTLSYDTVHLLSDGTHFEYLSVCRLWQISSWLSSVSLSD